MSAAPAARPGDEPRPNIRRVDAAWPALLALAAVVTMSVGMLVVDLVVDQRTAEATGDLVGDSLRSVALADDLRYQAYRLATVNLTPDQIASIAEQIDVDARAFDPLATSADETAEWRRLQGLLAHLRHEQPLLTVASSGSLVPQIETSIGRLVAINQEDARRASRSIAAAHRGGLVIDCIVGAITLALATIVGLVLVRMLRRQRALLGVHLASLDERARELAAFAARTAHDLKQPLSPIRGYADLLTLHESEEVAEPARRIARASLRMTGVIEDMLALAVEGRPPPGRAAIARAVRDVLDDLRGELRDAEVVLELPPELEISCSPGLLGQALRNVIMNAAKYRSPARKLVVEIEAHPSTEGDRVELAIHDNGIGMDQARAFEPRYRANAEVPGHGLGLAIVRRAVESVGGRVALRSAIDRGTTVTFDLPA